MVLASASSARAAVLKGAGVPFDRQPSTIDETSIKCRFLGEPDAGRIIAAHLATEKAQQISHQNRGLYVIGADQTLSLGTRLFDKPTTRSEAEDHLNDLKGKTHTLNAAVAVAMNGEVIWRDMDRAHLTMRDFTDTFLKAYLDRAGDSVFTSVGGYRLEDMGAQLFERIDGDYFTILGLPLLPLLDFLRQRGVVAT